MSPAKREPRDITIAEIEQSFELASYWFRGTWCPAVERTEHGFHIRFVKSYTVNGAYRSVTYDYFELDADGVITTAPRGYAKVYKPARVVDIADAADRFAEPLPGAERVL